MIDNVIITKLENKKLDQIGRCQGLNSNKTNNQKMKLSIKDKTGIPNRLTQCNQLTIDFLKDIDIYFYDQKLKDNIQLDGFVYPNEGHDFHISFNPNRLTTKERLKDIMRLFFSKYGFFIYGKAFPKKMNLKFTISIEQETYNHLHIIVFDMIPDDFKLFAGYFENFMLYFFPNADIFFKVADDWKSAVAYDTKKPDTIFLTQKDFKNE